MGLQARGCGRAAPPACRSPAAAAAGRTPRWRCTHCGRSATRARAGPASDRRPVSAATSSSASAVSSSKSASRSCRSYGRQRSPGDGRPAVATLGRRAPRRSAQPYGPPMRMQCIVPWRGGPAAHGPGRAERPCRATGRSGDLPAAGPRAPPWARAGSSTSRCCTSTAWSRSPARGTSGPCRTTSTAARCRSGCVLREIARSFHSHLTLTGAAGFLPCSIRASRRFGCLRARSIRDPLPEALAEPDPGNSGR